MIIDKDTLYRFLVKLDEQYGSSTEYFAKHPCNEYQLKMFNYKKLCDEIGFSVGTYHKSIVSDDMFDTTLPGFDFSPIIGSYRPNQTFIIKQDTVSSPEVTMPVSDPRFKKLVNMWLDTFNKNGYYLPSDVITIDDMSFQSYQIFAAINEHAVLGRLKRMMIVDRNVSLTEQFIIKSEPRLTDAFCDEMEELYEDIHPYFFGSTWPVTDIPDEDKIITWDDIINAKCSTEISHKNSIYLCETLSQYQILPHMHSNIVKAVNQYCDIFSGILLFRILTQSRIVITNKDVPEMIELVDKLGRYVSVLRRLG